jgi:amidohydrolase
MIEDLVRLRHHLHSQPESSGREENTARIIRSFIERCKPDTVVTGLGGHGIAAIFGGNSSGPRILIRCELDALPIPETLELPYGSTVRDVSHKCGHDGHMTIVSGLAVQLSKLRAEKESVVLLFQPSEETGEGAELVLNDPKFKQICPDYVFALHNLPGYSLGEVILSDSTFASASCGLAIRLTGSTSHAAEPHNGRSPALAIAQIIEGISCVPQFHTALHEAGQATIIHAELGEVAFGTSPGRGTVMATLRSPSQDTTDMLVDRSVYLAEKIAAAHDLHVETNLAQPFPSTVNDPDATAIVRTAAGELGMSIHELEFPFAWSEDFGHFTSRYKGSLFGLGSGTEHPALHHPEYDFPDQLIEHGVKILMKLIQSLAGESDD